MYEHRHPRLQRVSTSLRTGVVGTVFGFADRIQGSLPASIYELLFVFDFVRCSHLYVVILLKIVCSTLFGGSLWVLHQVGKPSTLIEPLGASQAVLDRAGRG